MTNTLTPTTAPSAEAADPLSRTAKTAVLAECLDAGVDHEIDLHGLVVELEADGFTITLDPPDSLIEELLIRAPMFTTVTS